MDQQDCEIRRVVVEGIHPQVDGGRFAVKRIVGDELTIEGDVFADGHDAIAVRLQFRHADDGGRWQEQTMDSLGNDRWRTTIRLEKLGGYSYRIIGWIDRFQTWRNDLKKRHDAGQNLDLELQIGAELVRGASLRATELGPAGNSDAGQLVDFAERIAAFGRYRQQDQHARFAAAMDDALGKLAERHADRSQATISQEFAVAVDGPLAGFSAWYELFPRSYGSSDNRHGTFRDVIQHLPYVAEMGFDVLYLPPIHPIGTTFRKGKNNRETAEVGDVGSPWAIGAAEGGHKAIHSELGSMDDFRALVDSARKIGLEIALDIAFQCSPDHPYVKEHPNWFRHRPDGTIQYAENPPKKYQDIYPFDFECADWRALWEELRSVFLFWVEQGVCIFRVDNPHTKPFGFWEWCIQQVKQVQPAAIFLAEAFTRPKIMYRLAKLGFTQSYTYFTWRNTKQELIEYLTELSQGEMADIFRPNFWTNTPDILHEYLQHGGRPAFIVRAVLAATLAANWGVYGAAYELLEHTPREPGSEEYLDSEKYELKRWNLNRPENLHELLRQLNHTRRENPALQRAANLTFHAIEDDHLLAYSKRTADSGNIVLVVVNLDPHHSHSGWLELPRELIDPAKSNLQLSDLLTNKHFDGNNGRIYFEMDPSTAPAHLFVLRSAVQ